MEQNNEIVQRRSAAFKRASAMPAFPDPVGELA